MASIASRTLPIRTCMFAASPARPTGASPSAPVAIGSAVLPHAENHARQDAGAELGANRVRDLARLGIVVVDADAVGLCETPGARLAVPAPPEAGAEMALLAGALADVVVDSSAALLRGAPGNGQRGAHRNQPQPR